MPSQRLKDYQLSFFLPCSCPQRTGNCKPTGLPPSCYCRQEAGYITSYRAFPGISVINHCFGGKRRKKEAGPIMEMRLQDGHSAGLICKMPGRNSLSSPEPLTHVPRQPFPGSCPMLQPLLPDHYDVSIL